MPSPAPTILAAIFLLLAPPGDPGQGSRLVTCLGGKPALRVALPPELREVSGFTLTADGRLLGHDDEFARVVELDRRTGAILKAFRLGGTLLRGDFEAVTMAGDRLLLATSTGVLYQAREGRPGETVPYTITRTGAGRSCEIEGMAWEPAEDAVYFLCKTSRATPAPDALVLLRWSLGKRAWMTPDRVSIPMARPFRGSDLSRDPVSGNFLAVSSLGRSVVEFTTAGRLIGKGPLGKHHRQAEALAVARDGTVWVGDEGGNSAGTLSVYACGR